MRFGTLHKSPCAQDTAPSELAVFNGSPRRLQKMCQQRWRTIQSRREFTEVNAQSVDELDFLRTIKIDEFEPP
jgi:hypothetical protein